MKYICDFHIHSKYSRATSKAMDLENLNAWAHIKGMSVLGTGDFTHPAWFKELKTKLEPAEPGLFRLRERYQGEGKNFPFSRDADTRFILTVEISGIYSRQGKTRRIHNLIFAPSLEVAEKINTHLGWIGNLNADGRPILGLDSEELAKIVLGISGDCFIVPAHAWTPWFSVFGSMSGFDTIEECFGAYTKYISTIETGLSSDTAMNWRLSMLDSISLISNSDSHSLSRIGREANILDTELSYAGIIGAIRSKDSSKFISTIEFFPAEGRYHFDGHRNCGIRFHPDETKKHSGNCPRCGKHLTIGVLSRVEELADRKEGEKPARTIPYYSCIPLEQIIGDAIGVGAGSKMVQEEYKNCITKIGSEFHVLLEASREELERAAREQIVEGIMRVREGKVEIEPGYDGEYGTISIFKEGEQSKLTKQASLFL